MRSGSPVRLRLTLSEPPHRLINAARAMRYRHLPLRSAKGTIDRLAEFRAVEVLLPVVEDVERLTEEMTEAGVVAEALDLPVRLDAHTVRSLHNLSVADFADSFRLDPATVEAWEATDDPDPATVSLLRTIAYAPNAVRDANAIADGAAPAEPPREAAE